MRPRNPANLFTATPIAAALAAITLATPLWTGSAQSAPATTATRLLPQALPGTSYAAQLAIPPGLGYPFAHCELVGQSPRWLTIDCARLQLKGRVPAAPANADANYQLTLRIEDNTGNTQTFPLALRVSNNPQVVSLAEPVAQPPQGPGTLASLTPDARLQPSKNPAEEHQDAAATRPVSAVGASAFAASEATHETSEATDSASAAQLSVATAQLRRTANRTAVRRSTRAAAPKQAAGDNAAGDDPAKAQTGCSAEKPNAPQACKALKDLEDLKYVASDCGKRADKSKCDTAMTNYQNLIDAANADGATLQKDAEDPSKTTTTAAKTDKQTEAQQWEDLACDLQANRAAFKAGTYKIPTGNPPASTSLNGCYQSSPYFRGLLGGIYSAASSTDPQFKLLADLTVDLPIGVDKKPDGIPNSQKIWLWGYTRVGSVSQQASVIDPSQIAADYAKLANAQPSQIVQSFEMNTGIAYQLKAWQGNLTYFDHGSFSLIAGGGALTPLSPSQIQPETFSGLQTSLVSLYPTLTPKSTSCDSAHIGADQLCYISYYPQDRSRFYSDYEAGLRVKLYPSPAYLKASPFPALFDVTVGQNEYVTGGKLRGVVLHFGGSAPISPVPGLYAFGGMDVGINNRADQPINAVLTPFSGSLPSTVPLALKVIQPPPNRDRYSLGFGLDILQLLRTHQIQDAFDKKK
jgi:hypothetical protein